jgi:hypothetical protein
MSWEILNRPYGTQCGLLNQEDALSAPCLQHLLWSDKGCDVWFSLGRRALMLFRWLAADARGEHTDARPSRAVVKTALTCGFLFSQ